MRIKLPAAWLLLNISSKDAYVRDKGDSIKHAMAFGVDLGAVDHHHWPALCMQMQGFCEPVSPRDSPTQSSYDSLPEMSFYVKKFAGIVRSSFATMQLFLNGSIFD